MAVVVTAGFWLVATPAAHALYADVGGFSGPGSADGELTDPGRAAVNQTNGNLYVADGGNDRVEIWQPDGDGVAFVGHLTHASIDAPLGVAIDQASGAIYVSDADDIAKFDSALNLIGAFTAPGVTGPIAVDPTDGDLLVADQVANEVKRFNSDGTLDGAAAIDGSTSPGGVFTGLLDVAVNSTGDIYVVDANGPIESGPDGTPEPTGTSRVERFGPGGGHQATLTPVGPSQRPATVTVDPATDNVFASGEQDGIYRNQRATLHAFDQANTHLQDFSPTGAPNYVGITGLASDTTTERLYVVHDQAFWSDGGTYDSAPGVRIFEDVTPAEATLDPHGAVGFTTAEVSGTVNPQDRDTTYRFEFATQPDFSDVSSNGDQGPIDGVGAQNVSTTLTGLAHSTHYYVRLAATNAAGTTYSPTVEELTTDTVTPPVLTLNAPANVDLDSAELSGTVDPTNADAGFDSTWHFDYATKADFTNAKSTPDQTVAGAGAQPVTATIDDLEPNTTHYVRLVASNTGGETIEGGRSFTTDTSAPGVRSLPASGIQPKRAFLRGEINAYGEATTYYFDYGETTAYGSIAPAGGPAVLGVTRKYLNVDEFIEGLTPGATYHYRLVAKNATGETEGPDRTFTTRELEDSCPNAEARRIQGTERLPDCRAYEQVSPADKGNYPVYHTVNRQNQLGPALSAVNGEAAIYQSWNAFPGTGTEQGVKSTYRSHRTSNGWVTRSVSPRPNGSRNPSVFVQTTWQGASENLDVGLIPTDAALASPDTDDASGDLYTTADAEIFELANVGNNGERAVDAGAAVAPFSADGQHFLFLSTTPVVPEDAGSEIDLYERSGGGTRLVGVDGNETPVNSCGTRPPGAKAPSDLDQPDGRISDDGSRIFFVAPYETNASSPNPDCQLPQRLYVREDADATVEISRSRLASPEPDQAARFLGASADGSVVYFSSERITEDSLGAASRGVYRWLAEDDSVELIRQGDVAFEVATSRDGSTLYFAEHSPPSQVNIYAYREGSVRLVHTADNSLSHRGPVGLLNDNSAVTSDDGSRLAFGETASLRDGNPSTDDDTSVYVYDYDDDELTCIQCRGTGDQVYTLPMISRDGSTLALQTTTRLLPEDTNNKHDVYQWRDDGLSLISDPNGPEESALIGVSHDGAEIFFSTPKSLVPADFDRGDTDVYVARVSGGFDKASGAEEPDCVGEGCLPPPTPPPGDDELGTDKLGAGNPLSGGEPGASNCQQLAEALQAVKQRLKKLRGGEGRKARKEIKRTARLKARKKIKRAARLKARKKIKRAARQQVRIKKALDNCEVPR